MTDRQNGNMNRSDDDFGNTQYFKPQKEEESAAKKVLSVVYEALTTKGYDPVNQIVGYIMSGDPRISQITWVRAVLSCVWSAMSSSRRFSGATSAITTGKRHADHGT